MEQSRDKITSDIEELLLIESSIDKIVQDLQGTVHGTGGAGGVIEDLEQRREKLRPLIGKISASDLTDCVAGRRLDPAFGDIRGRAELEQNAADLGFVGVTDQDLAAELVEMRGPGGDDKGAQDGEGGLAQIDGDGIMGGNGSKGERE